MATDAPTPHDRDHAFAACELQVLQRGWLSSNNILFAQGPEPTLVDTGYASHSTQTLALVRERLQGRPLARIVNTHLHSDHCGGNAALQQVYPRVQIWIPEGDAEAVREWNPGQLSYDATGQMCPRFAHQHTLRAGDMLHLCGKEWQVHAAPGHDQHSVVLFQPDFAILISADALWENGFGVVFPELDGASAFDDVGATLDLIEALSPRHVIPGHGAPFSDVSSALMRARSRLAKFIANPVSHHRHALKVLLKFKLLEWQHIRLEALRQWCQETPYMRREMTKVGMQDEGAEQWLLSLVSELCQSGAARMEQDVLFNE